jgi:TonB family protein
LCYSAAMPRPHFWRLAILFMALSAPCISTAAQYSSYSSSLEEPLKGLASDIAHASKKLHCSHSGCTFLVTNFVSDDGETSRFAMQVADALNSELSQTKSTTAVDRSTFQKFLESERLPARVQSENSVARWLARRLAANAAIVGKVTVSPSGVGRLSVTLLEPDERKGKAIPLSISFSAAVPEADLSPSEGLDPLAPATGPSYGERVYVPGIRGLTPPHCGRMANPSYTDDARAARYSGTIVVDGYMGKGGEVRVLRIVKGAPYGLNDHARETLNTWKCDPAQLDGKPVPVIVPLEVSFHLY